MSAASDLSRHRDELARVRAQIAKEGSTLAAKRRKAADARASAARSRSESTVRSKMREAESAERDANAAEKKRAELEKKAADIEKKIATTSARYDKEQQADQKKALDAMRRQVEQSAKQFNPPRRLTDVYSAPPGLQPRLVGPPRGSDDHQRSDVFLSHASEDKAEFARPLKDALESRGISVWFDEIKLKVGQSIRQEIEKGITHADFGVVILSPDFFAKQWTQAELDALFSKKMSTGENLILPIWHRVTKDQVQQQSPMLAGILALNTSLMTVDEIAEAIAEVVRAKA